jgi:hypothetical protein
VYTAASSPVVKCRILEDLSAALSRLTTVRFGF